MLPKNRLKSAVAHIRLLTPDKNLSSASHVCKGQKIQSRLSSATPSARAWEKRGNCPFMTTDNSLYVKTWTEYDYNACIVQVVNLD